MGALEVRPAVSAAVEDAVEGLVDLPAAVRPDPKLAGRIHPGVHGRGHQARAQRGEERVDPLDLSREAFGEPGQARARARSS